MMIRINLLPIEELEDNVWWVKPTIVCTCIAVVFLIVTNLYLTYLKQEITNLERTNQDLTTQLEQNKNQIAEYDTIQSNIDKMNSKLSSLQKITSSKVAKYRPLIIIELLQNFKPENMWFSNIELDVDVSNTKTLEKYAATSFIVISGSSLDPESVSNFMEKLEQTQNTPVDSLDLRTQIYFKSVNLTKLNSSNQSQKDITNFTLKLEYGDREVIKN